MEKLNLIPILRDCPQGMELDCTLFHDVQFDYIEEERIYPIRCYIKEKDYNTAISFTKYGEIYTNSKSKCAIFPKGKTTWEGFHRPFEDGDILVYKNKYKVKYTFIYKRRIDMHYLLQYCGWFSEKPYSGEQFKAEKKMPLYENEDIKFATEEEKQKLFQAIKDNGYEWNAETKSLEKLIEPKYKVSELVPNKFDINTLKPFDKVLVRDCKQMDKWEIDFFSRYTDDRLFPYECMTNSHRYCIPYEGNEHLLNKTDDCEGYYNSSEE